MQLLDSMSVWLMSHDLSIGRSYCLPDHVSGTLYADLPLLGERTKHS